ncbi:class E sortase [Glutamicibacter sp. 287]|uniref:class E sortase n=1 Tax=unclassified Glutamicibacter TaxID=2627139 RepID=UPI000BB6854E|nr:class E sortase [Glutamicibacter sp. BW80]PCC30592.1 class E sortase [Glutamicibacter sp. BW80]
MNRVASAPGRRMAREKQTVGSRITGFLGELLITLGIVLMLYVVWELWWTNIDSANAQKEVTQNLVQDLGDVVIPEEGVEEEEEIDYGPAPVAEADPGDTFGIMYFPTFGKDGTHHPVSYGVQSSVIDNLGIGYYPNTQLPGEKGNFAVAAHRQTHGQVFWDIDKLDNGDHVYLQTKEGYYTYTWFDTEIVAPSNGDVLLPTPHQWGVEPTESILTMTSCHPPFSTRERIIAYSELTDWRPLDAGPPKEIRELVADATS